MIPPPPPPPPPPPNATFVNGTNDSNWTNGTNGSNVTAPPTAPPEAEEVSSEPTACHFGTCRDFTFYREPHLLSIFPRGGPVGGGFNMSAVGYRLEGMGLNASIARCGFGVVRDADVCNT